LVDEPPNPDPGKDATHCPLMINLMGRMPIFSIGRRYSRAKPPPLTTVRSFPKQKIRNMLCLVGHQTWIRTLVDEPPNTDPFY